ncbi:MAG: hypothetical protein V3S64_10130, partial [bacterium]
MIAQGVLGFQYEGEERATGMTALAGLPVYLDLFEAMGLSRSIERQVRVRQAQGWSDAQMITSLVLLNLAGGESVDDLRVLEADSGFAAVLRETENHGLSRRERRALKRRWRTERRRAAPSPSAMFRYLAAFHHEGEEGKRERGEAFIPSPNEHLEGLRRVNGEMVAFVRGHSPEERGDAGHGRHPGGNPRVQGTLLLQEVQGLPAPQRLLGRAGVGGAFGIPRRQRPGRPRAIARVG